MSLTPQISYRNVRQTDKLGSLIHDKVAKLELMYDRISSCEVMLEAPHRSQKKGRLYHVRVRLAVPGTELVVGRDRVDSEGHQDVYVAVRDAFDAVRRQLQAYAERARRQVKAHTDGRA